MAKTSSPVTVIARHLVEPGREPIFERWMEGITASSTAFPGYMGTEVIHPGDDSPEHICIFRFDTFAHLDAWMKSSERLAWLDRVSEFSNSAPEVRHYSSLEFWFSPEDHQGRAPAKHKMALVTFSVIWPMVHFIPRTIASALPVPRLVAEACSVGTIVLLMTYVVMPTMTRLLSRWLFR